MTEEEALAKFNELYMTKEAHKKESDILQNKVDTLSSQVADNKRKERERMSEEERAKADNQSLVDSLNTQVAELTKQAQIRDIADQYKERGFDKDFAFETATALLNGDSATVLSNEKIFSDKQAAALRSSWEKEYNLNPPAGNGTGKVDYSAQIAQAQANGDMVGMASLIRQQNEANQ
jgi:ribonuclease HII